VSPELKHCYLVKPPRLQGGASKNQMLKLQLPAKKHTVPTGHRVQLELHEFLPAYKAGHPSRSRELQSVLMRGLEG
jgi:hypothetical protein